MTAPPDRIITNAQGTAMVPAHLPQWPDDLTYLLRDGPSMQAAIAAAEARGRPTYKQITAALEAKRWQVNYPIYGEHGGDWTTLRDVEIACAILDLIPAARADGREQGLRVKPLEWLGDESQGDDLVAKPDPYHEYAVRPLADCYDVILNHELGSLWFKAARQERWDSYAQAKAAAEFDYHNRITAALIPAPFHADGGDT